MTHSPGNQPPKSPHKHRLRCGWKGLCEQGHPCDLGSEVTSGTEDKDQNMAAEDVRSGLLTQEVPSIWGAVSQLWGETRSVFIVSHKVTSSLRPCCVSHSHVHSGGAEVSRCVQCGERLVSPLCLEPAWPSCPTGPSSLETPCQTLWTRAHKSCRGGRCPQVLGAVVLARS